MTFTVEVGYLLATYTYDISTQDDKHFVCTRREAQQEDTFSEPPEELLVTLGEEPVSEAWSKSLIGLYRQLTNKIVEHLFGNEQSHM